MKELIHDIIYHTQISIPIKRTLSIEGISFPIEDPAYNRANMATSPSRSILSTTTANTSPAKPSSQDPSLTQASSESYPTAFENQSSTQVKSMDYHRQVLKGKLDDDSYVYPSFRPC